jgi:uncharacterized protein (TIGR03084 family)
MSLLDELLADLRAEFAALDAIVASLTAQQWATATPAPDWNIRDQVWHLAWADGQAYRAIAEPEAYAQESARAQRDATAYHDEVIARGRRQEPQAILAYWREQSQLFQRAALSAGPRARIAWYDTQMSVISLVSARVMETWAHGQDVRDCLGLPPEVSDRLRHVAHIGSNAMPYAFRALGLPAPLAAVRVELELPGGALFTFGADNAVDRVTGLALDFCLVVTQRRHLADVDLTIVGQTAVRWMQVAQAFAGPPGPGRAPSQFRG